MPGSFLLDSNILIRYLRGEMAVKEKVEDVDEIFLSTVVIGELLYGARHSARIQQNLEKIYQLAATYKLVPCDFGTAEQYAIGKALLRQKGTPIPENDLWIAAQAIQHGLGLATVDRHFELIDGLVIEKW